MRIVLDLQGSQTESRFRGIGRYSLSLAKAIVRNRDNHDVIIVLNGLFPETIEAIRGAFDGILPQENIKIWYTPGPVSAINQDNIWRQKVGEHIREAFLVSLNPDIVHVLSVFEGWGDDAVTSIGAFSLNLPTVATLYDLMPLANPERYLKSTPSYEQFYMEKISYLKKTRALLAISEFSASEGKELLEKSSDAVVNISSACDDFFQKIDVPSHIEATLRRRLGLERGIVLYSSGADERKNHDRLIRAYAALPMILRKNHQLVLVGKMPEFHIEKFKKVGKEAGLEPNELVLTGYVTDEEMLYLYNLCNLFIFPSWSEGFGLPPLEAMACGAAVIAANATSLPEVIGLNEALFDPFDESSIYEKMFQALTNNAFRSRLILHGLKQFKKFSWEKSAKHAIEVYEKIHFTSKMDKSAKGLIAVTKAGIFAKKYKKILLIKLDHMGDFLLAIPSIMKIRAKYPYSRIDIIIGSWSFDIAKKLNVFSNIYVYDFFKKKSFEGPAFNPDFEDSLVEKLEDYDIAIDLRRQRDTRFLLAKVRSALKIAYQSHFKEIDAQINILLPSELDIALETIGHNKESIALQMLRLVDTLPADINDFIYFPEFVSEVTSTSCQVGIFPMAGNTAKEWGFENYDRLINILSNDVRIECINLYFSGPNEVGPYLTIKNDNIKFHIGLSFDELVKSVVSNTVTVSNNSFGAHISSYLGTNLVAIYGGHETIEEWSPVFGNSRVISRPISCSPCHDPKAYCQLNLACLTDITPDHVVDSINIFLEKSTSIDLHQSISTLEQKDVNKTASYQNEKDLSKALIQAIGSLEKQANGSFGQHLTQFIAQNFPSKKSGKQLFIDISELVQRDAKTGIQRAVRSILKGLLDHPIDGFRTIPIYATTDHAYRCATRFTAKFLEYPDDGLLDEPIEYHSGDIFFVPDLCPSVVTEHQRFYQTLRQNGVKVWFLVYDLLPVLHPEWFPLELSTIFDQWLSIIAQCDGAVCISRETASNLRNWCLEKGVVRMRPYRIMTLSLGHDLISSKPSIGMPEGAQYVLSNLQVRPSFLIVGTIEPRKGHEQTIEAFDMLWEEGFDLNLVIVGKQGWMFEKLINRIQTHPELGKRFFWLEGISDEYLEKIYIHSTCLIVASEGEGFGLPIIEAAQHRVSIIVRDIPVFREAAGQWAYFFSGKSPSDLAIAVKNWLELYKSKKHPESSGMHLTTWEQSINRLKEILLHDEFFYKILPSGQVLSLEEKTEKTLSIYKEDVL